MKNKIIPLIVLMFVVAISGCIQLDADRINELSPAINNHLKNGDNYFNKAASDLNKYSFNDAASNCNSALSEFNLAKIYAAQGLHHAQNSKDSVLIEYMQLTVSEIDARINATLELQQAINYLQNKDNVNGNDHVILANRYMDVSIEYKTKKDNLVNQNPSKFKHG
ncbi:MAG: hypothetical protein PQ964_04495 [Methanobacteriaceae archaeon]